MITFRCLIAWHCIMFPYGFYRQWGCKQEKPFDLLSHRIVASVGNGWLYCTPFGFCKLFNLANRIDIHYHGYDKKNTIHTMNYLVKTIGLFNGLNIIRV